MKRLFVIFLLFLLGVVGFGQKNDPVRIPTEQLISDELRSKPGAPNEQRTFGNRICNTKVFLDKRQEIKQLLNRSLSLHFTARPTASEPYYYYTARELIEGHPKALLHFRAYPATGEIKVYDPVNDIEHLIDE